MSAPKGRRRGPVRNQFSRPSVSLDKQPRSWQKVSPLRFSEGDIIPDHGAIEHLIVMRTEGPTRLTVDVRFISGESTVFNAREPVLAFTTGDTPWGQEAVNYLHRYGVES